MIARLKMFAFLYYEARTNHACGVFRSLLLAFKALRILDTLGCFR